MCLPYTDLKTWSVFLFVLHSYSTPAMHVSILALANHLRCAIN